MAQKRPFKKFFVSMENLSSTYVLAKNLRDARREVRERWYSHLKRLPDYVGVWESSPAQERQQQCNAALDMAWDLAMNDGGARLREVEARCGRA